MIQMASLLAVAAVFIWLMGSNIYILKSEGGLIHETTTCMQELELRVQGGLCVWGGCICGNVLTLYYSNSLELQLHA